MRLTIDRPLDVFEALATHAMHEHRHTPHQAAYLLTRWVRDALQERGAQKGQPQPEEGSYKASELAVIQGK